MTPRMRARTAGALSLFFGGAQDARAVDTYFVVPCFASDKERGGAKEMETGGLLVGEEERGGGEEEEEDWRGGVGGSWYEKGVK